MTIKADFSGAIAKTAMLKAIPQATKYQLTDWAKETVKQLKMSATRMQRSGKGKKTGALARSVGFKIVSAGAIYKGEIGTGVGTANKGSKYAKIQDEGGMTHPRVTKKMRGWAFGMYKETGKSVYLGIALTKKGRLDVPIPPSNWFSNVWRNREPFLQTWYLNKERLLRRAQQLSNGGGNA
jgi:hypothetical protein